MVNEEKMLPKRMRTMYQMEDLLQAEQVILNIIITIIEEMWESVEEIKEETLTPERLINIGQILTKTSCGVEEYPERIKIRLMFKQLVNFHSRIQKQLLDLIPAHLEVVFAYKVNMAFVISEKMQLITVRNRVNMDELKSNRVQVIRLRIGIEVRLNKQEVFQVGQMIVKKNLWFLDGSKRLDGDGETLLNAKEYKEKI